MALTVTPPFAPSRWQGWLARVWGGRFGAAHAPPTAWVEEYEPRVLYSADLAPHALLLNNGPQVVEQRVLDARGEFTADAATATQAREVVIVDGAVDDKNILLNQILTKSQRELEVIVLDAARDGVSQITAALAGRTDIAALHILSHGADGELQLGDTLLDAAKLAAREGEIAQWGHALAADADILLYGCDVAADARGVEFVQQLAALTGADVTASSNATGNATLGGDWVLEQRTGGIEAASIATPLLQQQWNGLLGVDFLVNTTTSNSQDTAALNRGSQQAVAYDGVGNFVVVWTSASQDNGGSDGVYARRFASDGTPLTGEIQVNATTADNQNQARVVSDSAGNFVVTWTSKNQDGSGDGVCVRRFAGDGTALTGEIAVNTTTTGNQMNSVIAMNSSTGAFVVAWQGQGTGDTAGVFFRRFNAGGSALDATEQGANLTDAGTEQNPTVAMDGTGNFVIAFDVNNHLYFQRFNSAGLAQGGSTQVDNFLSTSSGAAIAMDSAGNFTLVYREQNVLPILSGIWGRGFLADGTQNYTWFQADSGDAISPSLAMAGDGSFIVTYQKSGSQGLDIFARKYDASGSPLAAAFQVNQNTVSDQIASSIALRDMNNFVVVWSGNVVGDGDSNGVAANVFSSNVAPVNTVPGAQTVNEDALLAIGGISVSDADGNLASTQLTVNNGTLNVTLTGGATVIAGSNGSGDLTLSGSQAAVNATLATLRYQGTLNYNGPDTLRVFSLDSAATPLSDSDTIAITVVAVNDAPAAQNDAYGVAVNATLTVPAASGLLANDSDPEGNALSVLTASTPSHGTLSLTPAALGLFANLTNNAAVDTRAAWSPSGTQIAFDTNRNGNNEVYVMNTDGSGLLRLTSNAADDSQPAWSPDGSTIAFMSNRSGSYEVWVMNAADGSGLVQLTNTGSAVSGQPDWSPDGSKIAFTSDRSSGNFEIYVMNANGTGVTRLTTASGDDSEPAWSADGTKISFSATRDGNSEIYVMNADGTGQTRLTSDSALDRTPTWSLDGSKIAFISDRSGTQQIYIMDASGANQTAVTAAASAISFPDWSSDGLKLLFTVNSEVQSANITFDGGFIYTPTAGYTGADSFTYTVTDRNGGTSVATASINVTATNTAPVLASGSTLNYTENAAAAPINTTITVADVDSATLASATIAITGNFVTGEDLLGFTANVATMGNIAGSYSAATGVMTLSSAGATATQAQWQAALRAVTYSNSSDNPSSLARTVSYQVSDGQAIDALSNAIASTINVTAVNDAPTATNLSAAEMYTEDTPLSLIDIVISDVDSTSVTARLTLSNLAAGSLNTGISGAVTSTYNAGTGVWAASGALADVNTLLAALTFTPSANFNGNFTIATSVSDGVAAPVTGSKAMTGTAVNDAPTATNLSAAETYTEDTPLNLVNMVVSDVDSANVTATLTLSNAAAGSLNTGTSGAVTSTYNAGTGVWSASGAIVDVNALLAGLIFTPTTNFNASFTIATSVSDGVAVPITGSKAMTGVAVNDAPTATNLGAAEAYTEDTALNLTGIVISDIDSANVTATLTLSNAAAGSLNTATSGAVTSTYNAGTGVWTASGAISNVNTLLAGLNFTPATNFNASFTIATSVSDGVAAPITGSKVVTGVAVNDAPTATNLSAAETYTEDTALNLSDIVISDIDSATATATLTLSNAAAGSLNTGTSGAVTSTYNAGTGVWSASGAISNVNTLLAGLTFTPTANFNSSFTIATSVSDGVAAPLTGSKVITGVAVNDAPTATNLSAAETYTEDTALNLVDVVIGDIDSANVTATLTLSNPAVGSLNTATSGAVTSTYVAGTGVWTASGAIANVNTLLAGLTFTPAANFNGSFTIATSVSDGVAAPVTGSKNVTGVAVNDGPTATNLNAAETYTEDTALNLVDLVVNDIDSATVTATLTLSNPAAGSLNTGTAGAVTSTYNAGTGVWTASGAIANVNTLLAGLTFTPTANFNGSFTIATSVSDGVAAPVSGIKAMTGVAVNDAPAATNLSAAESYTEDTALNLIDMVVSDVDSANVTATLTLSNPGAGSLSTGTSGAVTSTYVAGTGVWTASGAISNVNTLLAGLTFTPATNFNGSFTLATSVSDGVAAPVSGVKAMTGIAVNDAPTATNLSAAETYTEDTALNLTGIVISDIDSANVTATLTLSNPGAGTLNTGTSGTVTSTYNAGSGVWSASGAVANVNTLLAGLTFTPAANFNGSFTIASSVSDGVAAPLAGNKNFAGIAVNDAPVAVNDSLAASEDTPVTYTALQLLGNDSDNDGPALAIANVVSGTGGSAVLNGDGSVTFTPGANFNGAAGFTYTATDGTLTSNVVMVSINVASINDAPLLTVPGALSVIWNTMLPIAGISATDVDGNLASLNLGVASGTLSVTPAAGALVAGNGGATVTVSGSEAAINTTVATLRYVPNIGFSGADTLVISAEDGAGFAVPGTVAITVNAVNSVPVIGGVATGSVTEDAAPTLAASGTLTISDPDPGQSRFVPQTNVAGALGTFSISSAGDWIYTAANSQPAVQQLGAGATRSETFTVVSADGSAARDVVITISGTDDGAVLAANTGARVDEGASLVLTAAMLDGSDIDGGPPPTYRVLTAPGSGVLNLAGNALRAGDTFTQDDINNGRLAYSHNGSETTADGFDFALLDATATAGIRDTFSLAITPLNDPPAAADVRTATSDSASVVFRPGDFGYVDAEGDALARIRITALPATGSLLLGTAAVGLNQEIAVADVAAGRLAFAPQPGGTAQVLAVIGFQVSDGQAYSAAHTVAITVAPSQMVAPPQDAPVVTAPAPDTTAPIAPASQPTATPAVQRPAASLPGVPETSPTNTTVEAALTPAAAAVSQGAPQSPARAPGMDGMERAAHRLSSDSLLPPSFITFAPGVLQAGFTPQNLGAPDASAATRAAAATGSVEFTRGLDRVREGARDAETLEQNILVSTVSASAGLSVGYVLWLLRGSLLLTSVLSSLPAWRFVDPLPVLGRLGDDEEEDTESLESIVAESGASGVRGAA